MCEDTADVVSTIEGAVSRRTAVTRSSWTPGNGTDSGTPILPACNDARNATT